MEYQNETKEYISITPTSLEKKEDFAGKVKNELTGGVFADDNKRKPKIGGLDEILLFKTEDETISSTTLQDDDVFTFYGEAGVNYLIDMMIFLVAPVVGGENFIFNFGLPSGTTYDAQLIFNTASHVSEAANGLIGLSANIDRIITIKGSIFMGTISGQVTFQWAEQGAGGGTVKMYAGSWMKYAKLIKL